MTQKEWDSEINRKLETIKVGLADYAEYVGSEKDSLVLRIKGKYFVIEPTFRGPSRKRSDDLLSLSLRFGNLLANGIISYYKDKKGVPMCLESSSTKKIIDMIVDVVLTMEETYIKKIHTVTKSPLTITMDGKSIE